MNVCYIVYQCSGDETSNWGYWDKQRNLFGRPRVAGGQKCGDSCDFWNLYEEDIERARSLGSNSFRLSLEWSRLQPKGPGEDFDVSAVQRYHAILDTLEIAGMVPFLTLHHYVHPQWFENIGGFQKEENIRYFVEYAKAAFQEFGNRTRFWATFNEPGVASFAGFIHGSFPPGKFFRIKEYGKHLLNMLIAHTETYTALKALPGGQDASIGIVHNWFWFEPAKSCCVPPYVTFLVNFLNKMWGNELLMKYLSTGEFDFNPLWYVRMQSVNQLVCTHVHTFLCVRIVLSEWMSIFHQYMKFAVLFIFFIMYLQGHWSGAVQEQRWEARV